MGKRWTKERKDKRCKGKKVVKGKEQRRKVDKGKGDQFNKMLYDRTQT